MENDKIRPKQPDHWCRHIMNAATWSYVSSLPLKEIEVLEISGWGWAGVPFRSYTNVSWPSFDICSETTSALYNLIIAEQVFEHLRHPLSAAKNVYKMLKEGGGFLITTPFLYKFHPDPVDYWRWSVEGLRLFLEEAGFQDVTTDGWGNKECVTGNLVSAPMFDHEKHSLVNEPEFPVVTWGTAKRISST